MDRRLHRSRTLAALAAAISLSGCANVSFDSSQGWFSKPLDLFGRAGGYTYSELQEAKRDRPITASDLIDRGGACPAIVATVQSQPGPGNPDPGAAVAPDTSSILAGGISLGMSECDVVNRAGRPTGVELGNTPSGERTAVVTYKEGPRPGVYHFERGRLMQMDRVEELAPPPVVKKKPAKSKKPDKKDHPA